MIFIDLQDVSARKKSMAELVSRLRRRSERAAAFAETFIEVTPGVSDWQLFAKEIPNQFWDAKRNQFVDANTPSKFVQRDNLKTAFALWQAGHIFGDAHLRELGEKALEGNLEAALQDSNAAAISGLAAARMSGHPLHIAVVGNPSDSLVTGLRNAAYHVFEPNKVILNLDPAKDAKRMETLMYPAEAAPALFVCVETLCSPPVRDPAQVEKQVAEIKKLAAEIQQ